MTSTQPKRYSQVKLAVTVASVVLFVMGVVRLLTTGNMNDKFANVANALAVLGAVVVVLVSLLQDAPAPAAARKALSMRRKVGIVAAVGLFLFGLYIVWWTAILENAPGQALLDVLLFAAVLSSGWTRQRQ